MRHVTYYFHPHRPGTRVNRPPSDYPEVPELVVPDHEYQLYGDEYEDDTDTEW